jgi:hypothetical protein
MSGTREVHVHVHVHFDRPLRVEWIGGDTATSEALTALDQSVRSAIEELHTMSGSQTRLQQEVDALVAQAQQNTTVLDSAVTYIRGVPDLIQKAVQDAIAAGAPPETLQSLNDVVNAMQAKDQEMVDALQANTGGADTTSGGTGTVSGATMGRPTA